MTGLSVVCRTIGGLFGRSKRIPSGAPPAPAPNITFKSRPAQKPRPAPVMTITRTSLSRSASRSARDRLSSIGSEIAFSASGRLSVIVAIAPSFS